MKERKVFKKLAGLVLAFVMILAAMPAIEAKAATDVTVHFKNTEGWEKVYVYTWDGVDMGGWPGTEIQADAANAGYYICTLTGVSNSTVNIIFGAGDGQPQTVDLKLGAEQASEWWVVPNGNDGKVTCAVATSKADAEAGNSTPVQDGAVKNEIVTDSIVENGNEVTFYYENANASKVEIAGSFNGWTVVEMSKDGKVYSYTTTVEPGTHEYKFIVDGNTPWIADPLNPAPADNKDGNSVFTIAGGAGNAGGDNTGSGETTGNVKYVIYGYSPDAARNTTTAAALWIWDKAAGGEGQEIAFTSTEEINGKTYLKAEFEFAATAELGVILKSAGAWDWQTTDLIFANAENADSTFYVVDGQEQIFMSTDDIPEAGEQETEKDTSTEEDKNDKEDDKDTNKKPASTPAKPVNPLVVVSIVVIVICVGVWVFLVVYSIKKKQNAGEEDTEEVAEEVAEENTEE